MVGTVKTKTIRSLKTGESALLLPGLTGAEPWEVWVFGPANTAECVQTCAAPGANRLRKNTTLALPVSQVFCLPLWLNETEVKQFAEMISLQLELRGLQPRGNAPTVFDWSVVATEGTRSLVVAGVLPSFLAPELESESYGAFDLSARHLPFPDDSVTIWQEQDRLVVAITRGNALVYWQALTENRLTPRVLQELSSVRASLSMNGLLLPLQRVVIWADATAEELIPLKIRMKLPVEQAQRPSPRPCAAAWKLTPANVGEAKRAREVAQWRARGLWLALAVYLVIVASLLLRLFLLSQKVEDLRKWQTTQAPALTAIRDAQASWKDLRPVVDDKNYPLELLNHTNDSIPTDQLNLTLFKVSDTAPQIVIDGEAKNVAAAFQFLDNLKKDSRFSAYTWDMGQPPILPNDLAKLHIEGTRAN